MTSAKGEAIAQAALELFAERGFYGIAVPEILGRAGASAGAMYGQFSGKEGLVNEVYRRARRALDDTLWGSLDQDAPVRAQLQALWRNHMRFVMEHPDAMDFLHLHHHEPYLEPESIAARDESVARFRAFLERGQAAGMIKYAAPEVLMSVFLGTFLSYWSFIRSTGVTLDESSSRMAEQCVWEALRA